MDKKIIKNNKTTYLSSGYDARDYDFPREKCTIIDIPEEYQVKGMPVLNQGFIGSCVAYSCATALGYADIKKGNKPHDFSRGFIYANRAKGDIQCEGMSTRQALKQLLHYGVCEYKYFPWNKKYPKVKAKLEKNKEKYLQLAEPYKIKSFFKCKTDDELKLAVLNFGAAIIGIPIYTNFNTYCKFPTEKDHVKCGHDVVVIGWNKDGWIVQNSWSAFLNDCGLVYIPYGFRIDERWGIEINDDLPAPSKPNWFLWGCSKIFYGLGWLWSTIKRPFIKK